MRKQNRNIDPRSFRAHVLAVVAKIPEGKTMSYKEVAARAGSPGAYRAVGNIMAKNRDPKIPCHRVICSDGRVGGYFGSYAGTMEKREHLLREGAMLRKAR
ncbi:MAG: MGMT family protein [bacterium]|nr:MGMT family protein [bacterium]